MRECSMENKTQTTQKEVFLEEDKVKVLESTNKDLIGKEGFIVDRKEGVLKENIKEYLVYFLDVGECFWIKETDLKGFLK